MKSTIALSVMFLACLTLSMTGCAPASGDVSANPDVAKEIRQKLLAKTEAAVSAQAEAGPAGFGSLKGQFVLGPGPDIALKLLAANVKPEDREVCAPGGQMPRENDLHVDSATRGIADVLVFARKTKNKHESATKPAEPEVVFDQKNCMFLSPTLAAQVGQTILVKNSDTLGHNTNIQGTSFNQIIPVNQATPFPVKAQIEAPKEVTCNIHPWMKAYMWFRKDGYFVLSGKDGTFEIKNLPAGEVIEFQVWHARARNGVALNMPDLKWDQKGRFKLTLQADQTKDLGRLEVPVALMAGG